MIFSPIFSSYFQFSLSTVIHISILRLRLKKKSIWLWLHYLLWWTVRCLQTFSKYSIIHIIRINGTLLTTPSNKCYCTILLCTKSSSRYTFFDNFPHCILYNIALNCLDRCYKHWCYWQFSRMDISAIPNHTEQRFVCLIFEIAKVLFNSQVNQIKPNNNGIVLYFMLFIEISRWSQLCESLNSTHVML